jgi:peptidyl-prolyl cis-trans isomerase B (cyclophilin B)
VISLVLQGCSPGPKVQALGCASSDVPCLSGEAVVLLETSRGKVTLRADGEAAPLTAGNFVDLVRRGVYDGTSFHRVVKEPVPFVVQGGDPLSADAKVPASRYGTGNFIDPQSGEARLIPLELRRKNNRELVYGTPIVSPMVSSELQLSHERGAVAMARSADPNSASAQFYIALEALPELDGRYAVFGRVTEGMDVVDRIQQGDRLVRARVMSGGKLVKGDPAAPS